MTHWEYGSSKVISVFMQHVCFIQYLNNRDHIDSDNFSAISKLV